MLLIDNNVYSFISGSVFTKYLPDLLLVFLFSYVTESMKEDDGPVTMTGIQLIEKSQIKTGRCFFN